MGWKIGQVLFGCRAQEQDILDGYWTGGEVRGNRLLLAWNGETADRWGSLSCTCEDKRLGVGRDGMKRFSKEGKKSKRCVRDEWLEWSHLKCVRVSEQLIGEMRGKRGKPQSRNDRRGAGVGGSEERRCSSVHCRRGARWSEVIRAELN